MPYVFYEELPEGAEEAEVVPADDAELLKMELEEAKERLETVKGELDDAKRKFADSFLSAPQKAAFKGYDKPDPGRAPMTFAELFDRRNDK